MASARKTLAKSLFIMLLENYRNPVSPTVFFRQADLLTSTLKVRRFFDSFLPTALAPLQRPVCFSSNFGFLIPSGLTFQPSAFTFLFVPRLWTLAPRLISRFTFPLFAFRFPLFLPPPDQHLMPDPRDPLTLLPLTDHSASM